VGHIVCSGMSGPENIDALFSCTGGPSAMSIKSKQGHVTSNFCFCIHWDLWVTHSTHQCVRATECRSTIFHAQVGLAQIPEKVRRDT
jgi:hypothetical protein